MKQEPTEDPADELAELSKMWDRWDAERELGTENSWEMRQRLRGVELEHKAETPFDEPEQEAAARELAEQVPLAWHDVEPPEPFGFEARLGVARMLMRGMSKDDAASYASWRDSERRYPSEG